MIRRPPSSVCHLEAVTVVIISFDVWPTIVVVLVRRSFQPTLLLDQLILEGGEADLCAARIRFNDLIILIVALMVILDVTDINVRGHATRDVFGIRVLVGDLPYTAVVVLGPSRELILEGRKGYLVACRLWHLTPAVTVDIAAAAAAF